MNGKNKIGIKKIINDNVKDAVFSALELINAEKLMTKEGMTIVLKPNVLSAKPPERAVTTHPNVLRAVIQWVKQFNPFKIYVCDSSGGINPGKTEESLKVSNLLEVSEKEGAECIPFEKSETKIYKVPKPLVLDQFPSSKLIEKSDLIINIPKIKTHGQFVLTCCIKNMFGTMLLANKAQIHARFPKVEDFSAALADIYSVSKPQLTVIDGYLAMEGKGPAMGDVVKMDLIIAGFDPVALDTTVCNIIGIDPKNVMYISKAETKNLGSTNLSEFEILGEKIENVKHKFKLPRKKALSLPIPKFIADYAGKVILKPSIKFDPEKCILCGTCMENCPVEAISIPKVNKIGNTPIWDKKKCITCYCCAELCPEEAIDFKVNIVKNFLYSWIGAGFVLSIIFLAWVIYWIFRT
ncbi:MAG: DUF362 domain-containing protein [Promethearchaeota archaeon]